MFLVITVKAIISSFLQVITVNSTVLQQLEGNYGNYGKIAVIES